MNYLILLFTIVPAIELFLLIKVGSLIGAGNTLFLIILTGVTGASLAKYQGISLLQRIQEQLNAGQMPDSALIEGVMILIGGILLLTPGFITDFLGFLLLIPLTRTILRFYLSKKFEKMISTGQTFHFSHPRTRESERRDDIIDI